jgi:hypothetical protein
MMQHKQAILKIDSILRVGEKIKKTSTAGSSRSPTFSVTPVVE